MVSGSASPATELSAVHTMSAVHGSLAGEAVSLKFSISQVGESKCTSNVFVQRGTAGTPPATGISS